MNKLAFFFATMALFGCSDRQESTPQKRGISPNVISTETEWARKHTPQQAPSAQRSEGDDYLRSHTKHNSPGFGTKGDKQ